MELPIIQVIGSPVIINSSGVASSSPCLFYGFFLGHDGVNDPTITIYDHAAAASGEELVPTCTYGASGLHGANNGVPQLASNGVYVEITTAGTCEVLPLINASLAETQKAMQIFRAMF